MRLVFFGSGAFGVPTLRALHDRHEVRLVVTQPPKPSGRGGKLTPTPIGEYAAAHMPGVEVITPEKVNRAEVIAQIRGAGAAAWVVIAFGQKLGRELLADVFAINLHASLLPRWRGAAPIHAAVCAGDSQTGNSVITLADRMDAGLVLGTSRRPILPTQTSGELHDLLSEDGPSLVLDVLSRFEGGGLSPLAQDESRVTIAAKMSKADGVLDWSRPAREIRCRVNGLNPWPGVTVRVGNEAVKLLRAEDAVATGDGPAGVLTDPAGGVVRCGGGTYVRLLEVQPAGKRAMVWGEFARGRDLAAGAVFGPV